MILNADELAALDASTQHIGVFFYLATTPAIRLWMGIGKVRPGVNAIDLTGQTYTGFGELVDVPATRMLVNGAAERMDFVLSGVSLAMMAHLAADAIAVKGKRGALGFAIMSAESETYWQLLGPVRWPRQFTADYLSFRQGVLDSTDGTVIRTLVLSVGTEYTDRRQPPISFWTDRDQRRRSGSPADKFCERTVLYSQETKKVWPQY